MPFRITTLFFLLAFGNVNAADAPAAAAKQFKAPYDIEIVIFERYGQGNGESWPSDPGRPDSTLAAGNLSRPGQQGPGAMLLPKSARELGPAAYTLRQKGAQVHFHQAWRQDVKGRTSRTWYRVGNKRLNGLVRVSRGRYLHLDTDLMLYAGEDGLDHRIQLHRRMRGGELHYVDHPKIGILIRTARLQVESTPPAEPEPQVPEPVSPIDEPGEQRSPMPGSLPRAMPDPT